MVITTPQTKLFHQTRQISPALKYSPHTLLQSTRLNTPLHPNFLRPIHENTSPQLLLTSPYQTKAQRDKKHAQSTKHKSSTYLNFHFTFTDSHFYAFTSSQSTAKRNAQNTTRQFDKKNTFSTISNNRFL